MATRDLIQPPTLCVAFLAHKQTLHYVIKDFLIVMLISSAIFGGAITHSRAMMCDQT